MRRINPIQHNFVKYTLYHEDIEPTIIKEPDNWRSAKKEFSRSVQYHGMIITLSDQINFSGEVVEVLNTIFDTYGVLAEVTITEDELDPLTDEWERVVQGRLDFSTYDRGDNFFSCKINANVIVNKFQSRWRTELDLANDKDLDGNVHGLSPVAKQIITIGDRGLQGTNLLDIGSPYELIYNDLIFTANVVLFTNLAESYYNLPQPFQIARERFPDPLDPSIADIDNIFFFQRQNENVNVNFEINYNCTVTLHSGASINHVLCLREYVLNDTGSTQTFDDFGGEEVLRDSIYTTFGVNKYSYSTKFSREVPPNHAFVLYTKTIESSGAVSDITIDESSINIYGDTKSDASNNPVFMPFDFYERFVKLMSGGRLESDYLTDCRLALANGFMVRNVKNEDGTDKPTTFTFQKLYNSFDAIEPIGLSANGNTVKIEKREYFYQKFISYDFGDDISDIKFSYDKETAYSEINIGFEVSNFSKEDALDEYAVRTVWTSPINIYRKKLNMVSDIQASSYVIEKLRRIQYNENVERTYSRRGDTTLFFIHLEDDAYEIRKWDADFETPPQNLFRSGDAYNLMLSPVNRLRKLGNWINHGLMKFTDKELIYSSSTGDSGMITTPIGKTPIGEQDDIKISECGKARFVSEKVTFKIESLNLNKILNEKINGVEKMYGRFGFKYKGENKYGYLLSFKPETSEVTLQVEY
ncbi:MAG: hypothetical protein ABFS35_21590 [Bacteroidota bacterium]